MEGVHRVNPGIFQTGTEPMNLGSPSGAQGQSPGMGFVGQNANKLKQNVKLM